MSEAKAQVNIDQLVKDVAKGRKSIYSIHDIEVRNEVLLRLRARRVNVGALLLLELDRAVQIMKDDDPEEKAELKKLFAQIRRHSVQWEQFGKRVW